MIDASLSDGVGDEQRVEGHAFAEVVEIPVGISFVEEPDVGGRLPAGVVDGFSAKVVDDVEAIDAMREAVVFHLDQFSAQFVGEDFVGVDGEDKTVVGKSDRILALRAEAGKDAACDLATVAMANFDGAVCGI